MPYKSPCLITVRKKGSDSIPEEYSPAITTHRGIPHPVSLVHSMNKASLLTQAVEEYNNKTCVLWIENVVSEAQETYDYFCSQINPYDVGLLHSRSTARDRETKEENWAKRLSKDIDPVERKNSPCILIGTQVCEQSLDIDGDSLYTSLCPVDMFLQRIGRIWRHRKFDSLRTPVSPVVHWFGWEGHSIESTLCKLDAIKSIPDLNLLKSEWRSLYVYEPYIMSRTIEVLSSYSQIQIPGDIRELVEKTYA